VHLTNPDPGRLCHHPASSIGKWWTTRHCNTGPAEDRALYGAWTRVCGHRRPPMTWSAEIASAGVLGRLGRLVLLVGWSKQVGRYFFFRVGCFWTICLRQSRTRKLRRVCFAGRSPATRWTFSRHLQPPEIERIKQYTLRVFTIVSKHGRPIMGSLIFLHNH